MSARERASSSNLLVAAMPAKDREQLLAGCQNVDLSLGEFWWKPEIRFATSTFPR